MGPTLPISSGMSELRPHVSFLQSLQARPRLGDSPLYLQVLSLKTLLLDLFNNLLMLKTPVSMK